MSAIPKRAWSGRSWLTACCGGCCLGFLVLLGTSGLLFGWLLLGDGAGERINQASESVGKWWDLTE